VTERVVSIVKNGVEVNILAVDDTITDAQITAECAAFGCTCDCVVYTPYNLGDKQPPDVDVHVHTIIELDNCLRTEPNE
jgi:hypothetical protein